MSRFPDPYDSRDDVSHASVFLIALFLLISVTAILFFSDAWLFAPIQSSSLLSLSKSSTLSTPTTHSTPAPGSTIVAPTPVPPLAAAPIRLTPNGTVTPTPKPGTPTSKATPSSRTTPSPQATHPPPGTPSSGTTPNPPSTASPQSTPEPKPTVTTAPTYQARIANTGGDGVFLRKSPHLNDKLVAWPDNTPVQVLGPQADGDGTHWLQVQDPRGNVGWIPAQYVQR